MIIQFGEWLPDQPRVGNRCITATNVRPTANGYGPFPGPSVVSDALPAGCTGAFSFRSVSGTREHFAGTETNLYRKNGDAWDDVTATAGYQSSTFWRFALYGSRVIATNGLDNPQKFDINSDSEFSDLTNAPVHRYPIVVRDVLVALDVRDGSGNEVAFSAVNNSESWTTATGGGAQSLPDGGPVRGGVGGEVGVIIQESRITLMNFVGGDLRFTFDGVEGSIGCIDAESIVPYKGGAFYLSSEGFQFFNGAESQNISANKVTDTFFSDSSGKNRLTAAADTRVTSAGDTRIISETDVVQGALDPKNTSVIWSYPATTGKKLIGYNYSLGKWFESTASVDRLHTAYQTSGEELAGFNSSNELVVFTGADQTAVVSTGDLQLFPGRSAFVSSVIPMVDSSSDVVVGKKTPMLDAESTSSGSTNTNGRVTLRSHGRHQRFQVTPTAAFTELVGVDVEARPSGSKV